MNNAPINIFEILGTTEEEQVQIRRLIQSENTDTFSMRLKTAKITFLDKFAHPFKEESVRIEDVIITIQKGGNGQNGK